MKKIRFGVIGCGYVARKGFLPALQQTKMAKLVAATDLNIVKAEEMTNMFGGEPVLNYKDLVKRKDIDAVYIATPNKTHSKLAIAVAENGKHLICEKPLAHNLQAIQKIISICEEKKVALLEGFTYQFHPQHKALDKLVADDCIGDPVLFQAKFGFPPLNKDNFRYQQDLGGGALLDAGSYTVHAARRFFGKEPTNVYAVSKHKGHEVDIHGSVLLDFGNSKTAILAFGFDNYYQNTYSIWGTKGKVTLTRAFSISATFAPKIILERQSYREEHTIPPYNQFAGEIEAFCAGLNEKDTHRVWRNDAIGQAQTLERIRKAAGI